jgi:cytochrome c peroxidase
MICRQSTFPFFKSAGAAAVLCLILALLSGVVPAQVLPHLFPAKATPLDREPITPVPPPPEADAARLELGERLFQDRLLSHDQTLACSSCHDTRSNGADGLQHALGADGAPLALNTLTVFNAALSFRLNWEGKERTLEAQAEATLNSPHGMGSSTQEVVTRLKAVADMSGRFLAAYGREPDRTSLLDALATYQRSLVTPGSRFDRWLDGDAKALSAEELNGYRLFNSLGCISCHQGVNVGGNLFQRHGIFHPLASPEPKILRVPSLRNVATTPPYFHDGSVPTLAEAVRKMAAAQLDQSLSAREIEAIVAFLGTLTGMYRGVPVKAKAPAP